MNYRLAWLPVLLLMLGVNAGYAQDSDADDEIESTIRLMGEAEAELPDAVTKEISLPAAAIENSAAVEKAVNGLQNANANRERREAGQDNAAEAKERGAEMAEEARQNRENRGRSENRPDRPDRPDPPNPPGPPGNN